MWPGFLHSHHPSPVTTLSGSHPRWKCGVLDSRNMNVTVCHSCSHAPGAPGKPRQTPRVEAGHAPLAWPLPPLQTLSCKTHNGEVSAPRSPLKLQSPHLATEALPQAAAPGKHATTGHVWITGPPHPHLRIRPQKRPHQRLAAVFPSCLWAVGRAAGSPCKNRAPPR